VPFFTVGQGFDRSAGLLVAKTDDDLSLSGYATNENSANRTVKNFLPKI
jgi:hypothetical protein